MPYFGGEHITEFAIDNPHNTGEYTYAPWMLKVVKGRGIVHALNPNGVLQVGVQVHDDTSFETYGDLARRVEGVAEPSEADILAMKRITELCLDHVLPT